MTRTRGQPRRILCPQTLRSPSLFWKGCTGDGRRCSLHWLRLTSRAHSSTRNPACRRWTALSRHMPGTAGTMSRTSRAFGNEAGGGSAGMKSPKQLAVETALRGKVKGLAKKAADILLNDAEIQHLQEYANTVSIKRLGFNDHG